MVDRACAQGRNDGRKEGRKEGLSISKLTELAGRTAGAEGKSKLHSIATLSVSLPHVPLPLSLSLPLSWGYMH